MATKIKLLQAYRLFEIEDKINKTIEEGYALVGSVTAVCKLSGDVQYIATMRKIVCSTSS